MRRNGKGPPRGSWLLGGPSRGGGSAGIRTLRYAYSETKTIH